MNRAWRRLGGDFHLSLMAVFVVLSTLALFPFLVYRTSLGDVQSALINGVTLVVIYFGFGYSWITGKTDIPRKATVVYLVVACISTSSWLPNDLLTGCFRSLWRTSCWSGGDLLSLPT